MGLTGRGTGLKEEIEALFDEKPSAYSEEHQQLFAEFRSLLNSGTVRAAEPDPSQLTGWRVNPWVKKGILIGFRMGEIVEMNDGGPLQFFDKSTYPTKQLTVSDGVRIVPGGSSLRDGCYVGQGVTCMPPMYINVGAYVGDGTMIDSHALIGSCAQIGRNCHISAASQIGGVLEPVGALPVIVEDDVLVGGNCGVYEGTIVKRRAVLGTGTILNRSTPVYDLVRGQVYRASEDIPLMIPEDAVVVAGTRKVTAGLGAEWGISLYTPVIVKYRDATTETKIQLEDLLR
ncbi:MAG: 2,3,4,5-tetrahydropyridine-2,6-dicarboxylate N-succinyltransferase [Acidobacteriaceae bacterium]|nr:2,3,4,5-tetrahydropyridine-2,6-dicarboxylate N-succinyltransferase [Acidobacteriaceae bacterium]MBV9225402.1 2,3,4,5-tetrahydropyridine-2,6-dicarboxylate N-succinyltransferase [Acidobacteriaceae bacterium]MBV9678947.1 2,3,4,5-tetrahydropyridine-2,6-dicarboxylate N-succinyltransferase [Acidobacteriaceae bacterium]